MAHHMKVEPVPHQNKDGTLSKTKKDYVVKDRTRKGTHVVGVASSPAKANALIETERARLSDEHKSRHPNDLMYRKGK